jgi:hypothetical protein
MRDNIKHAITVEECSMVVEARNHAQNGWGRNFSYYLMREKYSIFRMIDTLMNHRYYPIQGYEYWQRFSRRKHE